MLATANDRQPSKRDLPPSKPQQRRIQAATGQDQFLPRGSSHQQISSERDTRRVVSAGYATASQSDARTEEPICVEEYDDKLEALQGIFPTPVKAPITTPMTPGGKNQRLPQPVLTSRLAKSSEFALLFKPGNSQNDTCLLMGISEFANKMNPACTQCEEANVGGTCRQFKTWYRDTYIGLSSSCNCCSLRGQICSFEPTDGRKDSEVGGRKLPLSPLRPTLKQDFGKQKPENTQTSSSTKRPLVEAGPTRVSKKPAMTGAFARQPLQVDSTADDTTFLHWTRGVDDARPAHKETCTKGSSAHRRPLLAPRRTPLQAPVTQGTTLSELKGEIKDVKASVLSLSSKVDLIKEEVAEFQQVVIHNQRLFGQALRELMTQSNCDASILDGLLAPAARDEQEHVE